MNPNWGVKGFAKYWGGEYGIFAHLKLSSRSKFKNDIISAKNTWTTAGNTNDIPI